MKIAIAGAMGRMGRALLAAVLAAEDMTLTAAFVRPGHTAVGLDVGILTQGQPIGIVVTDDASAAICACDVVLDFTESEASLQYALLCQQWGRRGVIGTTGLSASALAGISQCARDTAFVVAANMSVGVTLALYLLNIAAGVFKDADVEITEAHHRHKRDAPSGTALRMGEVVASARGQRLADVVVLDRFQTRTPRQQGSIGFASVRAGEIVGEHRALMVSPFERLEIAHVAESRQVFAEGALRAARFVQNASPGVYDMQDVLGLR